MFWLGVRGKDIVGGLPMSVSELQAATDRQLQRLERRIERHRLEIAACHPSQRMPQVRALQSLLNEYTRLKEKTVLGTRTSARVA
jgi:hypothetical protein